MEVENHKWQAGGGTTAMSIIGTAAGGAALLGGLANNLLGGGLLGGRPAPSAAHCQERCDMNEISTLKSEIAKLLS
jgi:hypothetical protein